MALFGEIKIPADKSISHRSLIFSALTGGRVKISNLSLGADCLSTLEIMKKLGVEYQFLSERDLISDSSKGLGYSGHVVFDCGNSGTTTRLLSGLFASLENLDCELIGDSSLSKRPMKRVVEPLSLMGADITSKDNKLPLFIKGKKLNPITYFSPVASAQVKSCLILAGLNTVGKTRVYEKTLSRNHSEIMLEYLGAKILTGQDDKGFFVEVEKSKLTPRDIEITGDISSAAFFMAAAAIVPNSNVLIKNVGINPTRSGIIDVFKQAQIDFELLNIRKITNELTADIKVNYTPDIKPFKISGDLIPRLIDEIPVLAVLMAAAKGESEVSDAADLRNKESDRIKTICDTFKALGINVVEKEDGFTIEGGCEINREATLETHLDHRLAMSYYVLSLINKSKTEIQGFDCVNTSFPEFMEMMDSLAQ